MLKPTIARADWVLNNPSNGSNGSRLQQRQHDRTLDLV